MSLTLIIMLPLAYSVGRAIRRALNKAMNERRFNNKNPIVVIGASSGIGRAFAKYFALHGFNVIAAARRVDCLNSLKSEVVEEHCTGQLSPVQFDMTNCNDIDNLMTTLRANGCGGIINCAGVTHKVPEPL